MKSGTNIASLGTGSEASEPSQMSSVERSKEARIDLCRGVPDIAFWPDGPTFSAENLEAMQIHERMYEAYLRANTQKNQQANILAGIFGLMAFLLVMFGPAEHGMTVNIFSASFAILSAGIAGFTQLKAKSFGHSLEAATGDRPSRTDATAIGSGERPVV